MDKRLTEFADTFYRLTRDSGKFRRQASVFEWFGFGKKVDKKLIQVLTKILLRNHPELKDQIEAAATEAATGNIGSAFSKVKVPQFSYMKPSDVRMTMRELKMNPSRSEVDKQVLQSAESIISQLLSGAKAEADLEYSKQSLEDMRQRERDAEYIKYETWNKPGYGKKVIKIRYNGSGHPIEMTVEREDPGWKEFLGNLAVAEQRMQYGDRTDYDQLTSNLEGFREYNPPGRVDWQKEPLEGTPDSNFRGA
jgi:hypothetical protein